jgi:predicted RND superfamily exporter protein
MNMDRYIEWIHRWRYLVILLTIVLVALAGYGGRDHQKNFKTDYRNFFSKENPQLMAFEQLQNVYSKNDLLLIAIEPKSGNVFEKETLDLLEKLSYPSGELSAWKVPYATRVDSIANFQHTYAEQDDLIVEDLVQNALELSPENISRIREIAIKEPMLINRLITEKSNITGVNIRVEMPGKSSQEVFEVAKYARELSAKINTQYPGVNVYLSGLVMLNNAFPEASRKDWATLVPLMFLVIAVVMGFMLRAVSGTIVSLITIFLSIIAAMGIAGWLEIWLTAPSATAPIIIMTLAVADCVHILVSMYSLMRDGMDRRQALTESMRINMRPVFLTSLTTAIGFMGLNFSDAPPFRDLGNITAIGVFFAYFLSIVFLPAMMLIMPMRVQREKSHTHDYMSKLAEFTIRQRDRIVIIMTIVVIVLASFIPRIELNDEFIKYFDKNIEFRAHTDIVMDKLTGIYQIQYSLDSGEPGGINNPDFLQHVEKFSQWYRQQEHVLHVNTITDTMKRLNMNMHADDKSFYRLPGERDLAAQYLLLYEMSLPFGLDLNNTINIDKSTTRIIVTIANIDNIRIREMERQAQQWLRDNPPQLAERGASATIMFANIAERNIKTMLGGTAAAMVLIAIVLIIALRSFKYGMLSLIPNFVPAVMGFGIWAIIDGQVGLALSVVAGMTLGIVVDDTVHFLSKYQWARQHHGSSPEDAVRYAFSKVGTALWVTSLTLIAGFLVLSTSSFELNKGMGQLTALVIGLALIADLTFLPALLMKFTRDKK